MVGGWLALDYSLNRKNPLGGETKKYCISLKLTCVILLPDFFFTHFQNLFYHFDLPAVSSVMKGKEKGTLRFSRSEAFLFYFVHHKVTKYSIMLIISSNLFNLSLLSNLESLSKAESIASFCEQLFEHIKKNLSCLGSRYIFWGSHLKTVQTIDRNEILTLRIPRVYDKEAREGEQKTHCLLPDFLIPYRRQTIPAVIHIIRIREDQPTLPFKDYPESGFAPLPEPRTIQNLILHYETEWKPRLLSLDLSLKVENYAGNDFRTKEEKDMSALRKLSKKFVSLFKLQFMQIIRHPFVTIIPPTQSVG